MLRGYMRDMHQIPEQRRIDLLFAERVSDVVGTAPKVLQAARLSAARESEEGMRGYMEHDPRGRDGRVVDDVTGSCKRDVGELRQRFNFSSDRFPARHEV